MNIAELIARTPSVLRRHRLIQSLLCLYPDSNIQLLNFNGQAKAFVDLRDANARQYLITEIFEPEFFSIALPFLAIGGTFFDIGANFGLCSFGIIGQKNDSPLDSHLFEANPHLCQLLSRSASLYEKSSIRINCCCVSDSPGTSRLNIIDGQLGQSYVSTNGTTSVVNLTIDDYIREHHIKSVNFLKMDIEGHEPRALKGASASLKKGLIDAIYIEVSTLNLARANYSPGDCFDILRNSGFDLYYCKPVDLKSDTLASSKVMARINNQTLPLAHLKEFPSKYQTDILAVRRDLRSFEEIT
jgi:FkbM family methyltransferase